MHCRRGGTNFKAREEKSALSEPCPSPVRMFTEEDFNWDYSIWTAFCDGVPQTRPSKVIVPTVSFRVTCSEGCMEENDIGSYCRWEFSGGDVLRRAQTLVQIASRGVANVLGWASDAYTRHLPPETSCSD